ncbi:hypothetical protein K488DRAFT_74753 [Vararia minispora EC-137]|uniref:Uncharacterized protein n=1 Tax=Vararia minispora EC-137 TaxID=1314806 RepID=A0ACB8Q600_9AGAM|nr:hypothetical protein K488DRAFT_74753 [Vararia minispora EC-137]
MSVWPALQSFGTLLVGWGAPDVGSAWDEEMGSVGGPAETGSSTGEGNTAQGAVDGDHEVRAAQESPTVPIEGSAVADGVSAAGVEAAGLGNASNEGADNRLRLRAWGRGCGGCGISLPTYAPDLARLGDSRALATNSAHCLGSTFSACSDKRLQERTHRVTGCHFGESD